MVDVGERMRKKWNKDYTSKFDIDLKFGEEFEYSLARILSLGKIGFGLTIINFLKLKFFIALAQAPIFSDNCGL